MMNRFKELREQNHFTLQDLSDALRTQQGINISPDSLAKYERGERKPKIDKLEAIAEVYNTSVAYLRGADLSKLIDRKEQLKQTFIDEVRDSTDFYLKVTYVKQRIKKISVFYSFGFSEQKVFTVHCFANNEEHFETRTVKLKSKIELTAEETIEISHLLLDAGNLINTLNEIDKGNEVNY